MTGTTGAALKSWGNALPFQTDHTWTPSTYRLAHHLWDINNPKKDSELKPRKAAVTKRPKHDHLSRKLRSLITWRAMTAGSDWTLMAGNDNDEDQNGRKKKLNADCLIEVRPLISEIMAAINVADVQIIERRAAKLGGGGEVIRLIDGNDIERGKVYRQGKSKPDCITSIGRLQFSNGGNIERAMVLDVTGKPRMGEVRIPLGGLMKIGPNRVRDYFRHPKGAPVAANDNNITVGASLTATEHAVDFADPVADAQERERVRKAVGRETARVLDHALVAANFAEIGERLGCGGKTAERRGKAALIAACEVLEKELAA